MVVTSRHKPPTRLLIALLSVIITFTLVVLHRTTPATDLSNENIPIVSYTDYLSMIKDDCISIVYFDDDSEFVYAKKTDESYVRTNNPNYDTFKKEMLESGVSIESTNVLGLGLTKKDVNPFAYYIYIVALILSILNLIGRALDCWSLRDSKEMKMAGATSGGSSTKSSAQSIKQNNSSNKKDGSVKTFASVAGLYEVKRDVCCLVDFLKNKSVYIEAGAELPRGVIFYGPPGTGKTLLAKAIAGEASVPFLYASGSDFVEMYVGVGAKRVRELFEMAKKDAPCIIFIDEIDAIGCKRNSHDTHGEDRKTLNALLSEMDGFKSSDGILVIGATNRIEDLDEALLRPGRFTNKFCIPLPETMQERMEIIAMYAANKRIADNVSFEDIAAETIGFSPAALEALLNEAAIISVQDQKGVVDRESIDKAMFKVLMSGHVREDQTNRDKNELRLVAWHEAGHALIGKLNGKRIPKVTILSSTSGAGGVTFTTPLKTGLMTLADLKNEVRELYAGRVAEFILMGNDREMVTTGAQSDIDKATKIIKELIASYGMDDHYGMLNLNQLKVGHATLIDKEVELAKQLEAETFEILTQHKDKLQLIAEMLLAEETIYDVAIERVVSGEITGRTVVNANGEEQVEIVRPIPNIDID